MTTTDPHLDLTRLEKLRRRGDRFIARCPACAVTGGDSRGEHLAIMSSGKYACAAYPGDATHRREIFAMVGIRGERQPDPERDRRWRRVRQEERCNLEARKSLAEAARQNRAAIVARHRWDEHDVIDSSPQRIDSPLVELDPRHFLRSLFETADILWAGAVHESGERHAKHWKTCGEWAKLPEWLRLGPMITPATWHANTTSRAAGNVKAAPYTVLDFDEFDGRKPESPEEIAEHVAASLAITRCLSERFGWRLAAIIFTGSKSIHSWFHTPPELVLQSLRDTASPLGIDAGLIGRPEHPCRLPGQQHEKTAQFSRVLWLQCPENLIPTQTK